MKMNRTLALAISSLVAILCVAADVSHAGDTVPFKMSGTVGLISSEFLEDAPDFLIENVFQGEAKSTHLGKNSITGVQLFSVPNTAELGVALFGSFIQTATHTAANGDTLVIKSVGIFLVVPLLIDGSPFFAPIAGEGTWEVVGGTGRFENATGGGTLSTGLTDDGQITFINEGEISSVGPAADAATDAIN